jgi:hypothetical protein
MEEGITWRGGFKGPDLENLNHAWLVMLCMANEVNKMLGYSDDKKSAVAYIQPGDGRVVYVGVDWVELPKMFEKVLLEMEQARKSGELHFAPTEEGLFWKRGRSQGGKVLTEVNVDKTLGFTPDTLRLLLF